LSELNDYFKFYSQSPAFEVPLSRTLWLPRNPKTLNRYCVTTTTASPPAWSIRSFPLYIQALPVKQPPLRSFQCCHLEENHEDHEPMKPNNRQTFLARRGCDDTKNRMTPTVFLDVLEKKTIFRRQQRTSRCKIECPPS